LLKLCITSGATNNAVPTWRQQQQQRLRPPCHEAHIIPHNSPGGSPSGPSKTFCWAAAEQRDNQHGIQLVTDSCHTVIFFPADIYFHHEAPCKKHTWLWGALCMLRSLLNPKSASFTSGS
jgi:hypothetical protein